MLLTAFGDTVNEIDWLITLIIGSVGGFIGNYFLNLSKMKQENKSKKTERKLILRKELMELTEKLVKIQSGVQRPFGDMENPRVVFQKYEELMNAHVDVMAIYSVLRSYFDSNQEYKDLSVKLTTYTMPLEDKEFYNELDKYLNQIPEIQSILNKAIDILIAIIRKKLQPIVQDEML